MPLTKVEAGTQLPAQLNSLGTKQEGADLSTTSARSAVELPARFGAAARPRLKSRCKRAHQYVSYKPARGA